MRHAVTSDDDTITSLITGGDQPERRLAIHRRHFRTSLVNALLQKFPAVGWLIGAPMLASAASQFVCAHPPTAPCIAEYGKQFPDFLSGMTELADHPYILSFCEFEWLIGQIAVAIDAPAVGLHQLSSIDDHRLPDLTLMLQPGLRYLTTKWPVDQLMQVFLSGKAPESFSIEPDKVCLELRGTRGTFGFSRVAPDMFSFRSALASGVTVGHAAQQAFHVNPAFNLTTAFSNLFADGLVIATK